MLEDGEIGEDDFQSQPLQSDLIIAPQVSSPPQKKSKRNNNKQRDLNSIKRKKINTESSSDDDSSIAINDDLFSNKDYDSRLDSNEFLLNNHTDKDDRQIQPKFPSLMSTTVSSSWSTPMSKNEKQITQQQQPKSLLDLFLTTGTSLSAQNLDNKVNDPNFINPVLIEKENKPKYNQTNKTQFNRTNTNTTNANKRKIDEDADNAEKLISTESIEKKLEKKRKYLEIQKEKQKNKETKPVREPILCKFFLEGRCQKGAECPFSHNVQLNKKYEVCKYYLNGFCAKEDKCLFMHSEFPCKFYHRKNFVTGQKMNQCLHNDSCRFSHQPITNPLLQEAFEKHLAETEDNKPTINTNIKTSLLGSPPQINNDIPSLMNISIKPSTNKTTSISPPQSPPQPLLTVNPLMSNRLFNEVKKQPLLATPIFNPPNLMSTNINSLMGTRIQNIHTFESTIKPLFNEDVDERSVKSSPIPLIKDKLLQSNDVDERSIKSEQATPQQIDSTNTIKQELIIKIMKSLADETGGVFAQIPKQTLTELLVKLINSNDSKSDGIDVVINLLTSLSSTTTNTEDSSLNESSSNLQIDLNSQRNYDNGQCSDYDDDDEEYDLIIEGQIGDMPYQLIDLDVPPSKLWSEPPQLAISNINDPAALAAAADQESDPRIKYYSNIANCTNVANFQKQLQQQHQMLQLQQQQMTPTSPSANSSTMSQIVITPQLSASALSPSGDSTTKPKPNRIADPRLLRNQHNSSPTRSISPPNHDQLFGKTLQQQNDLISIQNRQLAGNSLLSSLPDLQFPKDNTFNQKNNSLNSLMQQQQNEPNTVKLSIEDYKRKLQKPTCNTTNTTINNNNINKNSISSSILSSNTSTASSSDYTQSNNQNQSNLNTPSLPSIPSYLQAPQSLHELLRNFQS